MKCAFIFPKSILNFLLHVFIFKQLIITILVVSSINLSMDFVNMNSFTVVRENSDLLFLFEKKLAPSDCDPKLGRLLVPKHLAEVSHLIPSLILVNLRNNWVNHNLRYRPSSAILI